MVIYRHLRTLRVSCYYKIDEILIYITLSVISAVKIKSLIFTPSNL